MRHCSARMRPESERVHGEYSARAPGPQSEGQPVSATAPRHTIKLAIVNGRSEAVFSGMCVDSAPRCRIAVAPRSRRKAANESLTTQFGTDSRWRFHRVPSFWLAGAGRNATISDAWHAGSSGELASSGEARRVHRRQLPWSSQTTRSASRGPTGPPTSTQGTSQRQQPLQ